MTNFEIEIKGAEARVAKQEGVLTSGMVGATVNFTFDEQWDGLFKVASFRASNITVEKIAFDNMAQVPKEVLQRAGHNLFIGVCGCDDGMHIVIPTVWAKADMIYPGAELHDIPETEETPSLLEQVIHWQILTSAAADRAAEEAEAAKTAATTAEDAARKAEEEAAASRQVSEQSTAEAEASKKAAEQSAAEAAAARTAADLSAQEAAASAEAAQLAQEAARSAEQLAQAAQGSAADAQLAASQAERLAADAQTQATLSADHALAAQQAAGAAELSAQNAQAAAEAAQKAAQEAAASAANAETSAQNAEEKAQQMEQTMEEHLAAENPHGVDAEQLGLGNVDNTSDVDKPVSTAQAAAIADAKKAGTDAQTALDTHEEDRGNPHGVTAEQTGADPTGTAAAKVSEHNTATASHEDIRLLITGLTNRLNALADSDDTTLDQLSELVAYIKDNRELIESVTTSKVSVTDIVDNLETNVTDKPLSAAQGVALKALCDDLLVGKLDTSKLQEAIDTALAQAKASGEFDGDDGQNGTSVTVTSITESGEDGGSNVVKFSDGKTLNVKNGKTGAVGPQGPQGPAYTLTDADKNTIAAAVKASLATETFKFTLEDGSVVTKEVFVK